MKSILISIKPKYVAKILNKEKTIEIRKTMPKCDLPIDVYIYCTKDKKDYLYYDKDYGDYILLPQDFGKLNGKVVAKFTLNKVEEITNRYCKGVLIDSCLTNYELNEYLGNSVGYAWHISRLEIFDKPKELSEFYKIGFYQALDKALEKPPYPISSYGIEKEYLLTKAPQSYCFIEVENE